MPRAVVALVLTVAVTVLLVNFRTSPQAGIAVVPSARSSPPVSEPARTGASRRAAPRQATKTVVGPRLSTPYGDVQVAATVSGPRVADVRALVLPSGNPQTDAINAAAGPALRQEAISAQSASIDTISGASYTSAGYRQSLQAALDRARA